MSAKFKSKEECGAEASGKDIVFPYVTPQDAAFQNGSSGKGVVAVTETEKVVQAEHGANISEPKRYRKNTVWHVHCPKCDAYMGKFLNNSSCIVECRRCHNQIAVVVDNGKVLVFHQDEPDSDKAVERVTKYQESLQRLNSGETREKAQDEYRIIAKYDNPVSS